MFHIISFANGRVIVSSPMTTFAFYQRVKYYYERAAVLDIPISCGIFLHLLVAGVISLIGYRRTKSSHGTYLAEDCFRKSSSHRSKLKMHAINCFAYEGRVRRRDRYLYTSVTFGGDSQSHSAYLVPPPPVHTMLAIIYHKIRI